MKLLNRLLLWIILLQVVQVAPFTYAFDGDFRLNDPNFQSENFLDIQSYLPFNFPDHSWDTSPRGFRLVEGSLTLDESYMQQEVKWMQQLNAEFSLQYHALGESVYARKSLKHRLWLDWLKHGLALGVNAFPPINRLPSQAGVQVGWGHWHQNHGRIGYTEHGQNGQTHGSLKLDWSLREVWWSFQLQTRQAGQLRFWGHHHHRFQVQLLDEQQEFEHEGQESHLKFTNTRFQGLELEILAQIKREDKTLLPVKDSTSGSLQEEDGVLYGRQLIGYETLSVLINKSQWQGHWRAGLRLDQVVNRLRPEADYGVWKNYRIESWQAVLEFHRRWSGPQWEMGLYAGESLEVDQQRGLSGTNLAKDEAKRLPQSKFRLGWQWNTMEDSLAVGLITTWNLDTFADTFWDGGGFHLSGQF